ncbi:bifunctional diguanylate cyclase/phosphodiesterase [Geminicoccus roseus]|uniref:bifunctional diguanylate cyclase/phosphodiesterase n=1 Tax=Geminicoccus roseus TaxID=404900 RepID=UPI000421F681|nr:EAL domain-containing protein [Geminicoccus roseus]
MTIAKSWTDRVPGTSAWAGHSSGALGLRVLAGFGLLAALAAVALGAIIAIGTVEQDDAAAAASAKLGETALRVRQEQLGRVLLDYSIWTEAHQRLHPVVDLDWAFDAGNIGPGIQDSLGYEYAFVVDAAGQTTYTLDHGALGALDAFAVLQHGLQGLIERARAGEAPQAATGLVEVAGRPALAAAAVVWTEETGTPFDAAPVLIFVDLVDDAAVRTIAGNYLLHDLRFQRETGSGSDVSLPLVAADGTTLGHLAWQPDHPGSALLRTAMPALLGLGGGFLVLAALVGRSLRRATRAMAASEERFRDLAEVASDWFWETDAQLRFNYVSKRIAHVGSQAPESMLGKTRAELGKPYDDPDKWRRHLADLAARLPFREFSYRMHEADGRIRHLKVSGKPVFGATGEFLGYRGTGSDITQEVEAAARIEFLSLHDPLTGLPNRLRFTERLEEAVALARRDGRASATVYLDLDRFKDVNDTLGHPAGDALLREVTGRLRQIMREADTMARLGGDEFAFVLPDCGGLAEAEAFCRRVLAAVAVPFDLEGHTAHVGASMGVAFVPLDAQNAEHAMRCADLALYRAKNEGRGAYRFYAPEMNVELQRRHGIEQDLRRALAAGEFELYFQPKYRTDGEALVGVEALLRWHHPQRGLVMPGDFIDLAEQTGIIVPMGEWILEQACAQVARWPDLGLAVNLSPAQFRSPHLVEAVERALTRSGVAPDRLELEVTESLLVNDLAMVKTTLAALKKLGVRLAMDDFGTGYSSLAGLQNLPFDRIKIDRSFVARLGVSADALAIVRAVVTLGQGLGMATTAEGVEDRYQLDLLRGIGCDEVQGFLLGQPMPAVAIDSITQCAGPGEAETGCTADRADRQAAAGTGLVAADAQHGLAWCG